MTLFSDLQLSPETLKAIDETGYTTPTQIQADAIPIALMGLDVLGIAQTGTGKTAAFTLPMIDRLASGRSKARMPRSLVLCPTRELADQVAEAFDKYAKYHRLTWALLIGGVSMGDQIAKLDKGVDVLIATPGRLLDLFERSKVLLTGVQIMVIDEADRMLDMGFIPDIERLFKLTPPQKQTLFFSATMPPEITRLTEAFLRNPVRIEATRAATTNDNISQYAIKIPFKDVRAKRIALRTLIGKLPDNNAIIFCNRKTDVDIVAKSLSIYGFDAAPIHGDLDQSMRTKTLERFRAGSLKLLVASDVAARGLDIPEVGYVFNFDVPNHADDYVHRIGRTGRAGKKGDAFVLIGPQDEKNYSKVLSLTGKQPENYEIDIDYSSLEKSPKSENARSESKKSEPKPSRGEKTETKPAKKPKQTAERGKNAESAPPPISKTNNNKYEKPQDEDFMPAFLLKPTVFKS